MKTRTRIPCRQGSSTSSLAARDLRAAATATGERRVGGGRRRPGGPAVALVLTLALLAVSPGLVPAAIASPFRLASQLQKDLRAAKKRFDQERAAIEARGATEREVRALIDGTEKEIGEAVDQAEEKVEKKRRKTRARPQTAQPALDPMRDWIRGEFDRIRAGLAPPRQAALSRLPERRPAPAVVFAAFVAPAAADEDAGADEDESRLSAGLDQVEEVLDLLYNFVVGYGLELRLWVGSVPRGAFFQLYRLESFDAGEDRENGLAVVATSDDEAPGCRNQSASRPLPGYKQLTNGTLKGVFPGSYTYRVEHSGHCILSGELHLLRQRGPFCCLLEETPHCLPLRKKTCRNREKQRRKREAR